MMELFHKLSSLNQRFRHDNFDILVVNFVKLPNFERCMVRSEQRDCKFIPASSELQHCRSIVSSQGPMLHESPLFGYLQVDKWVADFSHKIGLSSISLSKPSASSIRVAKERGDRLDSDGFHPAAQARF